MIANERLFSCFLSAFLDTDFLQEIQEKARYHYWLFGHYHGNQAIDNKHILLWEQIVQVI